MGRFPQLTPVQQLFPSCSQVPVTEIDALHKNDTWELVELPPSRKSIKSKWVFKLKADGCYRARLVFLNGVLDKEIYMEQPQGFIMPGTETKVCHLKRAIYGLKQASRT